MDSLDYLEFDVAAVVDVVVEAEPVVQFLENLYHS